MIALALMIAAAEPSAEALALGRAMAEVGTLSNLLPVIEKNDTEALVAEDMTLTDTQKDRLRAIAHQRFLANREKLMAADGRAYAKHLSVEDLRALVGFSKSSAWTNYRAALPQIAATTMGDLGAIDVKAEARAAFCKESGKLCPKP